MLGIALASILITLGASAETRSKATEELSKSLAEDRYDAAIRAVAAGADVNVVGEYGITPLRRTIDHLRLRWWKGNAEFDRQLVTLLLDKGADVNARDTLAGRTPLMILVEYWDSKEKTEAAKPLVELLLTRGANIKATDDSGNTPLHRAVESGGGRIGEAEFQPQVVTLLLDKGADVNVRDKFGTTPAMIAARCQNSPVLKILLARGAELDAPIGLSI